MENDDPLMAARTSYQRTEAEITADLQDGRVPSTGCSVPALPLPRGLQEGC